MLNFEDELNKLLSCETGELPRYEAVELAAAGRELLAELNRKQTDISFQIEEIYDLVKEQDIQALQKTLDAEKTRASQLVFAAMALSDLLEDFCMYAERSGSEDLRHQAALLWEHSGGILGGRGIHRFGAAGEFLNPRIHTVKAGVESPLPREQVVQVLQSGYVYQDLLLRKAAVVVSRGQGAETGAMDAADTGDAGLDGAGLDGAGLDGAVPDGTGPDEIWDCDTGGGEEGENGLPVSGVQDDRETDRDTRESVVDNRETDQDNNRENIEGEQDE